MKLKLKQNRMPTGCLCSTCLGIPINTELSFKVEQALVWDEKRVIAEIADLIYVSSYKRD